MYSHGKSGHYRCEVLAMYLNMLESDNTVNRASRVGVWVLVSLTGRA